MSGNAFSAVMRKRIIVGCLSLIALLMFLQWEIAGFQVGENLASLPGISLLGYYFYVPSVFRTEYGLEVPVMIEDGIKSIERIAPFPVSRRFSKRDSSSVALAIPVIGPQFRG